MRINRLSLFGLALAVITVYVACSKVEMPAESQKEELLKQIEEKFFESHTSSNTYIQSILGFMKLENDKYSFVSKTVKQIGYPRWDKALIYTGKSGGIGGRGNTNDSISFAYIPFVRDSQNFVNASLIVKTTASDTIYRYLCDWQYQEQGFDSTSNTSWNAFDVFLVFATLDKSVFNRDKFVIKDSNLLNPGVSAIIAASGKSFDSIKVVYTLSPVQSSGRGSNYWDLTTVCYQVGACIEATTIRGTTSSSCSSNSYWVEWTECYDTWIWVNTGGYGGGSGSGGSGSGTGGGGNCTINCGGTPPECQPIAVRGMNANPDCEPGWTPIPDPPPPPAPEPIDSILNRYSRAIRDTAIYIYDNLSQPNNVEYALTGIWQDNQVKIIERRTNNDSIQVFPKVMIGNLVLLFTWHSHVSRSLNLADRGSFSPDDIDMLRNVRCLKQNFVSFADCRNKRYALAITDVTKAAAFFANNNRENIWENYTSNIGGSRQEMDEASIINVISSSAANGISLYVSTDTPGFQSWTLLNQ